MQVEFPIRRMDWVENSETLDALTYELAINDIASAIDNPRDCIYTVGELIDVASRKFGVQGARLLGAATFSLGEEYA